MTGTVYDGELLRYLRGCAHAYIHGHKVGGTNPGLLEAMAMTDLNILYDCGFNREAGADAVLYFRTAEELKDRIEEAETLSADTIRQFGIKAKERMHSDYAWEDTVRKYDSVFRRMAMRTPEAPEA